MKLKKSKISVWLGALSLVVTLAFSSCSKEPLPQGEQPNKEYVDVTLELTPPGTFAAASKAMSDPQQNAITSAHVLVFQNDELVLQQVGVVNTANGVANVMVKFKTSQTASEIFDIMVIGNPPTGFDFTTCKKKAELKEKLTATITAKWADAPIAMYGEVLKTPVKPETSKFKIQMLRSLARIDIGVGAYTADATGTMGTWAGLPGIFSLTEVRVYNTRNMFAVIPEAMTFNAAGNIKVDAPTIPAGTAINADAWVYSDSDIFEEKSMQSTIFLAEAPNDINRVTLVVGGKYKGSTTITYYRIDMFEPNADIAGYDYLKLLRNHLYRITIVDIMGDGFSTAEEALVLDPLNITTTLTPIAEGGSGDVVFDDNNYLMTDVSNVLIYGEPDGAKSYNIAKVKASFEAGTSATVTGPGITTPLTLTNGVAKEISYVIPKGTKKGDFTIKVGTLSKIIPFTVQPAVDAHFDVLPFVNVASITVEKPESWLTLSPNITYVAREQQFSQIVNPKDGKVYLHFDENIVHDGEAPRITRALVHRKGAGGTTGVILEQLNLSDMLLGKFGGVKNMYGYTQQLAAEAIEEFSERIYDDPTIGKPQGGMQLGFYWKNITTNANYGREVTILMARDKDNAFGPPPYTIYRNYAARYCYDKNRGSGYNGEIKDDDVKWYLPAQNQIMGAWVVNNEARVKPFVPITVLNEVNYWSATKYDQASAFSVIFGFREGATYIYDSDWIGQVRCVRDI